MTFARSTGKSRRGCRSRMCASSTRSAHARAVLWSTSGCRCSSVSRLSMKSVTAAQAAAIGAWRVLNVGDRVGAIIFNDSDLVEIKARRSRATVLQILATIVAQNQALGVGRGLVTAPLMLNTALARARRLALHDAAA